MWSTRVRTVSVLVCVLGWTAAGVAESNDPVIKDILRMLSKHVDAQVILTWLGEPGHRPGPLTSDDLIALTEAGATPAIVSRMQELARATGSAGPSEGASRAPGPSATAVAEASASGVDPATSRETNTVNFSVSYAPLNDADSVAWDLYVYLDGQPLAWRPAASNPFAQRELRFAWQVPAGRHVLRVLQERHERTSRRGGDYRHFARVMPDPIEFDIASEGLPTQVRLTVVEPVFARRKPPAQWVVTRGGAVLINRESSTQQPREWAPLCEEIETAVESARPSRAQRRDLERCVRWAALWPGVDGVSDRAAVRAELARYDFRPVPAAER